MLLFWKLVDEIQMGNPCEHAARGVLSKFSIFLPLRAIYFRSYQYETPCRKCEHFKRSINCHVWQIMEEFSPFLNLSLFQCDAIGYQVTCNVSILVWQIASCRFVSEKILGWFKFAKLILCKTFRQENNFQYFKIRIHIIIWQHLYWNCMNLFTIS